MATSTEITLLEHTNPKVRRFQDEESGPTPPNLLLGLLNSLPRVEFEIKIRELLQGFHFRYRETHLFLVPDITTKIIQGDEKYKQNNTKFRITNSGITLLYLDPIFI